MDDLVRALVSYEKFGFAVVPKFFKDDEVLQMLDEFELFKKKDAPHLRGREINYVDPEKTIINSVHNLAYRKDGFFHRLLHSPRMAELSSVFLKEKAKPRGMEMFAKPAGKGLASPIHQDNYYWCLQPCAAHTALTLWCALDHVDESNGGVSYLSGTHLIGILDHVDSNAPGSSQTLADRSLLDKYQHVTPKLEPGDILVHDAMTVHWSTANTSGNSRRGMTMQFQKDSAKLDPVMLKHYESRLAAQLESRAKAQK